MSWLSRFTKEAAPKITPVAPTEDMQAQASSARSFILQPFWPQLLWALNEQREVAASKLRNAGTNWDEDARNLEHWRAIVDIVDFVHQYPIQIIEGGQDD